MSALAPLTAYRQFIVVRLVPLPNGKTDKLPIDPRTGNVTLKGSDGAHDPAIWLDYATATAAAQALGSNHTVGFVLTAADPFWCLDVDGARRPDGSWSEIATVLCNAAAHCAVEVSQSGNGLHIWGIGPVPPHRKKRVDLGIEFYSERRFIALGTGAYGEMRAADTGAALAAHYFPPIAADQSTPEEGPCPEWYGPTDDGELLRRALQSRSAASVFGQGKASFADLWDRNVDVLARAYPPDASSSEPFDASSADAALAAHLAFWSGRDVARIERLMRAGLAREKWDTRDDYLVERTIRGACARVPATCCRTSDPNPAPRRHLAPPPARSRRPPAPSHPRRPARPACAP
jgi:primase-polymerase (primpol)-like protein